MRNASKLLALVLAFVMVLGLVPAASAQTAHTHGIEEYPEIQLDVETNVNIDESGKMVYFRFTPEVTAEYTFASAGANPSQSIDPEGYLYDSEMNQLAYHGDNGTIDFNFTLVYKLEAGVTYVYGARLYSDYRAGVSYTVTLTGDLPTEHNYVGVVTTEPTCTTDGVMTYTCTECGDSYTEVIPGGHDYVDGICTRCGEAYAITGACGDDLTWKLDYYGTLTITGTGEMYGYTRYEDGQSPWRTYAADIKAVVIEEGVTTVGGCAFFGCGSLTSVTLPDSLTTIGESSFRECGELTNVDFGTGLTEVQGFAFMNCYKLAAADLGANIQTIGNSSFFNCHALAELNLGESLTAIGTLAFSGCTSLETVTMPDTVTVLGSDAFSGCTALTAAKLSNALTDLPKYTFNDCVSLVDVTMPQYLTTIGERAFYYCTSLESIDLPFSMLAIGDDAFGHCVKLSDIQLPMALSYVGYFAFNGCTALTDVEFPPNLTYFTGGCFYDCTGLTEIVFPAGTTYVDDDAFAGCTNVKTIVFTGDLPTILGAFIGIEADAYYPAGNETWTADALLPYGGNLTWHAMCAEHSFGKWTPVVPATCIESGIDERTCSVCGWTEERVSEPAGHIWDEGVEQDGKMLYTCLICGVTKLDDHVHSYEAVVTAPTCTEAGFTTYTCSCGDSYVADETAALGHDWKGTGCTRCDATRSNPFTDVPEDSFYIDPVLWAVEKGITNGATETTFNPEGDLQRAQVVTMLWRAAGEPMPTTTVNPFTDVTEEDFFYNAVLWAEEKGITNGISATEFAPYGVTNRAQAVTFLWRYLEKPETTATNSFTDVEAGAWYASPINWAVENGVTNGMGDGTFGIELNCNRAHMVTFLYRALAN